jgi:hypothetical protein
MFTIKILVAVGSSLSTGTLDEVVKYNSHSGNATYYIKVIGKNGSYNANQCYNLLAQAVGSGGLVTLAVTDRTNETIKMMNDNSLYPNPASEFVNLGFNSSIEGSCIVQIVNTLGQLVKQYPVTIRKGFNHVRIPLNAMKPGMYLLKINKDDLNLIRKFAIAQQ